MTNTPIINPLFTLRYLLADLTDAAIRGQQAESRGDMEAADAHAKKVLDIRHQIVDLFQGGTRT